MNNGKLKTNTWYRFEKDKGFRQALPPERKWVLVCVYVDDLHPCLNAVGWLKFAAGDKQCPFFVVPGATGMKRVLAWNDCLGGVDPKWTDEREVFRCRPVRSPKS